MDKKTKERRRAAFKSRKEAWITRVKEYDVAVVEAQQYAREKFGLLERIATIEHETLISVQRHMDDYLKRQISLAREKYLEANTKSRTELGAIEAEVRKGFPDLSKASGGYSDPRSWKPLEDFMDD